MKNRLTTMLLAACIALAASAAAWGQTLDEAARLHLRSPEVLTALGYVARGGAVAPLSILTVEGAPWA